MRTLIFRACLIAAAASLAACAQKPHRAEPAPVVEDSKPVVATPEPTQTPAPPTKPKPKPKPVAAPVPKPEVKETDVTPTPVPALATDGIERAQVGYYFDTLQGRLRQLVDPAMVVTHSDGHITVDLARSIHFGSDDAPLAADECATLAPIAKALVEYKMTRIVADVGATGTDEAALKSAKVRASAITKCLAEAGIAGRRLATREVAMPAPDPINVLRIEPIVK